MPEQEFTQSEAEAKRSAMELQLKKIEERCEIDEGFKEKINHALNCLSLLKNHLYKLCGYIYFDEGKQKFHKELSLLTTWFAYIEKKLLSSKLTEEDLNLIIELSVYLFTSEMVDEIGGMNKSESFRPLGDHRLSDYGRENEVRIESFTGRMRLGSHQFVTTNEIVKIFDHQKPEKKLESAKEILELYSKKPAEHGERKDYYCIRPFKSTKELLALMDKMWRKAEESGGSDDGPYYFINCQLQLMEDVSVWVTLTKDGNMLLLGNKYQLDDMEIPITPLPAVDRWRAIVASDVGYYDSRDDADFSKKYKSKSYYLDSLAKKYEGNKERDIIADSQSFATTNQDLNPELFFNKLVKQSRSSYETDDWRKFLQYKQKVKLLEYDGVSSLERSHVLDQVTQKHKDSFRRILKDPNEVAEPEIVFTRSGNSANLAAIRATEKILSQFGISRILVKKMEGWYFESKPPESWEFSIASKANVFLASVQPNPPQLDKTPEKYRILLQQNIETFLRNAARKPNKPFVLVIDKTTGITDTDYFKKDYLPDNVTLIETMSITKHQRGGKAHFFGAMAFWGRNVPGGIIQDSVSESTGELTPNGSYALPRLRKSEIERDIRHNQQSAAVFVEELDRAQSHLPKRYRWRLQVFNYYAFLLPPDYLLKRYFEKSDSRFGNLVNARPIKFAVNSFFRSKKIPKEHTKAFEKGDSFGLNATRITLFGIPYKKIEKESLTVVRIGFGRKTKSNEMRSFAMHVCKKLVESTEEILKKRN